jgi:cytochrome P450
LFASRSVYVCKPLHLGREFAKLEMKLFAALLIREYEWELLPGQNLEKVLLPFSHPRDGLKVKFWRLKQRD